MSLNSNFVGLLVSPTIDGFSQGTAYPIRDGVALTACHVIHNVEHYDTQHQVSYIRWPSIESKSLITSILYYCKDSDIAVIECETPPNLGTVILCKSIPESTEAWDSFGYAASAIDQITKKNRPESAAGKYFKKPNLEKIQQLRTTDHSSDERFWKGMSGAPIFTVGTSMLTGIFIESSICYDEAGDSTPIFKGRLRSASIAHLLDCPNFAKAVYGESFSEYQLKHEQKLRDYLRNHKTLAEILPSCDEILSDLKKSPITCIQELKKHCREFINGHEKLEIQSFFSLVLSQVDVPCTWQGKHIHELNVSTRLLAELAVAKMYQVTPQFAESEQLIGRYVIAASQTELGFDRESAAREQANVIAYALYKRWGNEGLPKDTLQKNPIYYQGVNEELILQREDDDAIHRFEINEESNEGKNHALLDEKVREHLQELLPNLPIVLYGKPSGSIFKDEERLQTNVRSFIRQIILS